MNKMEFNKKERVAFEQRKNAALGYAKELRKNATESEIILKELLSDEGILYEFQKPFWKHDACFIVDFYFKTVDKKKIIVELDGSGHTKQIGADLKRTRWLIKHFDIKTVIRFYNSEVLKNPREVLNEILDFYPKKRFVPNFIVK